MKKSSRSAILDPTPSARGGPTWEIAFLYPEQGHWTEEDYLRLDMRVRRLIEYSNGFLEFLPMPTYGHQLILAFLWQALHAFVKTHRLGQVLFAPLPVKLWQKKWREPDIVYLSPDRIPKDRQYPRGADLAVEVVSDDAKGRERDIEVKRVEYAKAGIPEYWIVDPRLARITVLVLDKKTYHVHGEFGVDDTATSVLLPGFSVSVNDVFAAGQ